MNSYTDNFCLSKYLSFKTHCKYTDNLYMVFPRSPPTACSKHKLNYFTTQNFFYIPTIHQLPKPKLRGLSQLPPHNPAR